MEEGRSNGHGWPTRGGWGGTSNARALRSVRRRRLCPACLGSDESSGGAHGVLRTEVDIVLLLPVDPVGPRALPVQRPDD